MARIDHVPSTVAVDARVAINASKKCSNFIVLGYRQGLRDWKQDAVEIKCSKLNIFSPAKRILTTQKRTLENEPLQKNLNTRLLRRN